ncbi:MAG: ATP-binding cassette domain-containing protein, partial [Thermomicrobiales bacterium]|nr:ATP-binding cassette domain-containing protein [Thermomicrobiales bacterium]
MVTAIADARVNGGRVLADRYSIQLRDLYKYFGDTPAVNGVSLDVRDGEFLTLLGPSGCGKTTTLRMVGGFELPSAGTIAINGEDMGDRPPYRRPVNTVFQNYALFP